MNRQEVITDMRQILVKRRDALRKALAGDLSSLRELRAQNTSDLMDAVQEANNDQISAQMAEVESRELARIEYALERMQGGNYGICEGCGCAIPVGRITALPYATYSITCQRTEERQSPNPDDLVDWDRLLDSPGSNVG